MVMHKDDNALDCGWQALCNCDNDWIEGYLVRADPPDENTRGLIKAIVDAYNAAVEAASQPYSAEADELLGDLATTQPDWAREE